ncbi:hypothetical protein Dsin_021819 [Dipteronia sinensis]|uniref:HAT C-terminal dimerisation domain-containing protein n=1 Tax=Dipteronia sinensis TaxID=43782 RepID=A0AAE0A0W2_9ROSI|nr:hypothetical protein Dsin_021819 [Dipteronia sinensis]
MLEKILEKYNGRVSVCADIWSDHWRMHSYIGVTCHYMDNAWAIQKIILAFRVFDEKHTAANIFRHLRIIFTEYKIENKIFAIDFDNASNNTAAIPALIELCKPYLGGKFFHQRCACHVFNLCVQKGLKTLEQFIQPIKDALYFLWKYPSVMKLWAAYCKQNGKRAIRFPRDVPTRSSSSSSTTYSELESYLSTSFGFIEDTEDKKFNILHWWKEHERYFPILAMIAKQILSTPVSTVPVEQQFSAGGNILDPKCSLMSPKSLQIQACVEDWTKVQYRQQEIDQDEPYDFFHDDQPAESRTDDHGND